MIPNVGPIELVIVLIIAVVVLGPKKLPEFGRSLGSSMREFKDSIGGDGNAEKEWALPVPTEAQPDVSAPGGAPVSEGIARD